MDYYYCDKVGCSNQKLGMYLLKVEVGMCADDCYPLLMKIGVEVGPIQK